MTATILLIRHAAHADLGQVLSGRTAGKPLSTKGEAQARDLSAALAQTTLAAVYSSPVLRACQTAEAVAQGCGTLMHVVEELNEVDFGSWSGERFDRLAGDPQWAQWNDRRATARPPGGESMEEVQQRAWRFIERTAEAAAGQAVAMISHCDVIRAVIARVLGLSLDNLLRFEVSPASVSRLEVGSWGARVTSVNEYAA
jgi:ribonuclease H / adenosylcobalamin/alpha-ribazole phosphatase